MKRSLLALFLLAALWPDPAGAFCGFYVARGDAKLFNRSSRVVLVRDGDRTALTMGSDYRGAARDFALVVPVPTVLARGDIRVADPQPIDHLDAFTAPRLVEYWDPDPCMVAKMSREMPMAGAAMESRIAASDEHDAKRRGVTIEARYTVGEYDILILSAKESQGLATWLNENGYKVPRGAARVLDAYLKQGMKFFVAKVNLAELAKTGFSNLRPLQMRFTTPRLGLPIRLGMANADGPQELFVYAITREGRVECTNYRTVKLPSDAPVPEYVKDVFPQFYRALFDEQVKRANLQGVFLEYAWDMAWCDPCAADPLPRESLRELGVWWLGDGPEQGGGAQNAYVTRLHIRYDRDHFPEDLAFQVTSDRTNHQGRFVITHPFETTHECEQVARYRKQVRERQEREARSLADLTGWNIDEIRARIGFAGEAQGAEAAPKLGWWERWWRGPGAR
jgi:hypothetical protein